MPVSYWLSLLKWLAREFKVQFDCQWLWWLFSVQWSHTWGPQWVTITTVSDIILSKTHESLWYIKMCLTQWIKQVQTEFFITIVRLRAVSVFCAWGTTDLTAQAQTAVIPVIWLLDNSAPTRLLSLGMSPEKNSDHIIPLLKTIAAACSTFHA